MKVSKDAFLLTSLLGQILQSVCCVCVLVVSLNKMTFDLDMPVVHLVKSYTQQRILVR